MEQMVVIVVIVVIIDLIISADRPRKGFYRPWSASAVVQGIVSLGQERYKGRGELSGTVSVASGTNLSILKKLTDPTTARLGMIVFEYMYCDLPFGCLVSNHILDFRSRLCYC